MELVNVRSTRRSTPKSREASVTTASKLLRTLHRTSDKPLVSEETFGKPLERIRELVEPGYGIRSRSGPPKRSCARRGLRQESEETFSKLSPQSKLRKASSGTCDNVRLEPEGTIDSSPANRVRILREIHQQTSRTRLDSEEPIDELSA